jgi:metal-sulfur cluster biosynthetic enzyme
VITREDVIKSLEPIVDPEIRLSIVGLGLIYDVIVREFKPEPAAVGCACGPEASGVDQADAAPGHETTSHETPSDGAQSDGTPSDGKPGAEAATGEGGDVTLEVKMTLTTPMCPYGPMLIQQVQDVASTMPGVRDTRVTVVWEPPWDPRTMASDEVKDILKIW